VAATTVHVLQGKKVCFANVHQIKKWQAQTNFPRKNLRDV